jgi:hypothetical protein
VTDRTGFEETRAENDREDGMLVEHIKEPTSRNYISMDNLQGFYPELVQEIQRRYIVIINTPPVPVSISDDTGTSPRHDLVAKPPSYSFTEIRKKLGLLGTHRHKREDDKIWKEARRQLRKEIASSGIRCISKSEEPGRLHAETLAVARKMLHLQKDIWKEAGCDTERLEEMAYWLVIREASITGPAAGFGHDANGPGNPLWKSSNITRPLPSSRRGRGASDDTEEEGVLRARNRCHARSSSIIRASDVAHPEESSSNGAVHSYLRPRILKPKVLEGSENDSDGLVCSDFLPNDSNSDDPVRRSCRARTGKAKMSTRPTRIPTAKYKAEKEVRVAKKPKPAPFGKFFNPKPVSAGKIIGADLSKWRAVFELRKLELEIEEKCLEAEEKQLALSQQVQAYEETYGKSYGAAA